MKLNIGNTLDHYDLDYSNGLKLKKLAPKGNHNLAYCNGCFQDLPKGEDVLYAMYKDREIYICADCSELVLKALERLANHQDGKNCRWCGNFSAYAENNYTGFFLCFSCNNHLTRVILGLE